jgi:hypothetical protein
MKKLTGPVLLILLYSSVTWAQHRGGGGGYRGGGSRGGISQGGFRGGGHVGGFSSFGGVTPRRAGTGLGSVVFPGGDYAGMRMRGVSPGVWLPWYSYWPSYTSFPSYYSYTPFFGGTPLGSYGAYPYAPAGSQPNVIVIGGAAGAQAQPVAPVVVNQLAPQPLRAAPAVVREYAPEVPDPVMEPAEAGYRSTLYLIALKTGLIQAALAYWVEAGELHYITRDRKHKQVALTGIDRPFTLQLNRERRVPFRLPPG